MPLALLTWFVKVLELQETQWQEWWCWHCWQCLGSSWGLVLELGMTSQSIAIVRRLVIYLKQHVLYGVASTWLYVIGAPRLTIALKHWPKSLHPSCIQLCLTGSWNLFYQFIGSLDGSWGKTRRDLCISLTYFMFRKTMGWLGSRRLHL